MEREHTTSLGIDFFRRAVDLQRRLESSKAITHPLPINGTPLTDTFLDFMIKTIL
jgi:sulfatase maturation enzyme AslB (radical SAM superfamily)